MYIEHDNSAKQDYPTEWTITFTKEELVDLAKGCLLALKQSDSKMTHYDCVRYTLLFNELTDIQEVKDDIIRK